MTALLAMMLSLMLTACSAAPMTSVQNAPPPASMLTPAEEKVSYTVEMTTWEDASLAEDGAPLVSYHYVLPELRALRADGTVIETAETAREREALAVTAAFNAKFATWAAAGDFEALTQEAAQDLERRRTNNMEWDEGYVLDLNCSVYQTEQLISVSGLYYSHISGAAHPNRWLLSWNFDLESGTYFDPDLLAESTELQSAVTEEIIRQANEPRADGTVPAASYWEDYREIAANWGTAAVSFDSHGMAVAFSPYELAPYGFGEQTFRLSYDFLKPYLSAHGQKLLGLQSE